MDYKYRNDKLNSKQLIYEVWYNNGLSPNSIKDKFNSKRPSEFKQKFNTSSKDKLNGLINKGGINVKS